MKIGHIEIFVNEPMKAKNFYIDILGFELVVVQGDKFVWLKKDGCEFLLKPERKANTPGSYQDAPCAFVFYTDDLEKTKNDLESRGLEFKGTDGSDSCLTFSDLDGNWFQLLNPNGH